MKRLADLDPKLWARYQAHRKEDAPAHYFKSKIPKLPFEFEDTTWKRENIKQARWVDEDTGYQFIARIVYDEYGERDMLEFWGEFTDEGTFPETLKRENPDRTEFKRFRPHYSIEDRINDYQRSGMAKGPAYHQAIEQTKKEMRHVEAFGTRWWAVGVRVWCFRPGDDTWDENEAIGTSSVWGVESDSDDSYFVMLALEQGAEAMAEARKELERDCLRSGQLHLPFFHV